MSLISDSDDTVNAPSTSRDDNQMTAVPVDLKLPHSVNIGCEHSD